MQRFLKKDDVIVGSRILFDNTCNYIKDLPNVKYVGVIVSKESKDDDILVALMVNGNVDPVEVKIPYFLAQ